jgi:hypothetical protein
MCLCVPQLKEVINANIIDWKYDVTQESSYLNSINHWFGEFVRCQNLCSLMT